MLRMMLASCGACASRKASAIGLFLLFSAILLPILPAEGNRWDSEGAALAYQEAEQLRASTSQNSQSDLSLYLKCARAYRKVHIRDPHYSRTGDAIYQEGRIYQEMGERFSNSDYDKTAIKRFQLLVTGYSGNQNCPDALLRTADIYRSRLHDELSAQGAYAKLKKGYANSAAAKSIPRTPTASVPPPMPQAEPKASTAAETIPAAVSLVQCVRHWSTDDYTRIIIDLDASSSYTGRRLSNPDRVYFDIANARLSPDLRSRSYTVEDQFLKQVRISQNGTNTVRVVLDLTSFGNFRTSELSDPFRIVIDLHAPGAPKPQIPASDKPEAEKRGSLALQQPPRAITEIAAVPPKPILRDAAASAPKTASAQGERPPEILPSGKSRRSSVPATSKPSLISAKAPDAKDAASPAPNSEDSARVSDEHPSVPRANTDASPEAAAKLSEPEKAPQTRASEIAAKTSLGQHTLTRALGLKIGRIVIDPGHGGHDQGTIGPGGMLEKDLVLSIAQELKTLLQERLGAEVFLTRTEDVFVTLEDRAAMANRLQADLFISIHANSSRSRSISGTETYYLDFAKTDAAREIASRENATTASTIRELEDLIRKIAQADKSAESKEFASIIQKNLYSGTKKIFPDARNRGVRSAPFIVLIGANMPSILTEVAFISNPRDERLLKKSTNQDRIVKALFSGIEGYMKTLGSDVAQNRPLTK
jgi:N-acetylmuramoyl-L-alanine amidase